MSDEEKNINEREKLAKSYITSNPALYETLTKIAEVMSYSLPPIVSPQISSVFKAVGLGNTIIENSSLLQLKEITSAFDTSGILKTQANVLSKFAKASASLYIDTKVPKPLASILQSSMAPLFETSGLKISQDAITALQTTLASSLPIVDVNKLMSISTSVLDGIDFEKYSNLRNAVLSNTKLNQAVAKTFENNSFERDTEIETIVRAVADNYVVETEDEQKVIDTIKSPDSEKQGLSDEKKGLYNGYIQTLIAIISIILSLCGQLSGKQEVPPTVINNVQYINNEYISVGYEADFLNEMGLRIVNRDIILRIKPDCSSRVTGKLTSGDTVTIIDKYKKWVEVSWKNEEGEFCSGWIQNYKLSEFQERKNISK